MKTKHIQKQLDFFVRDKAHHAYRKPAEDVHALAAELDRKSTRLNSSHPTTSRMPSSA